MMTQSLNDGAYGGPGSTDFSSPNQEQKFPNGLETTIAIAALAVSAPVHASEDVGEAETSPALLREGAAAGPSALQTRFPQLDLAPAPGQDVFAEIFSRRMASNWRDQRDAAGQVQETHHVFARHSYLLEDAMDVNSDTHMQYSEREDHTVAMALPSHLSSWSGEEPSQPNPNSNHDMGHFLALWRHDYERGNPVSPIGEEVLRIGEMQRPSFVGHAEMINYGLDMQGINWPMLESDRSEAMDIRSRYHHHPMLRPYPVPASAARLPETGEFFRFQHMNTEHRTWIEHWQLRNLVTTTSHNDIHYVSRSKVMSTNQAGSTSHCVMDLRGSSTPSRITPTIKVTALASADTMLIAGGYRGEYAIQNLAAEYGTEPAIGYVVNNTTASTNHIHTFNSRSHGYPQAVFCSNDKYLRTLDCHTGSVISSILYSDTMNCSATSPNGRLRILVGDFGGALVVDVDSGRILEHASPHSAGHGFACAWADNDIHVATAGQDNQVLVWDARNWSTPMTAVACESAYTTSLQFSPVGGGSPVLVAAELADTVSIIDARTYASKQTIGFFGDIAGIAMTDDGSQLVVANGDRCLGGLMTFQREDFGTGRRGSRERVGKGKRLDWLQECELEFHPRVRLDAKARRRRGLKLHDLYG